MEQNIVTVPVAEQRDIRIITTEIHMIQRQTQRMVLEGAIEIGRRLEEAKSMLNHGQWMQWLREEVPFSASKAQTLMQIAREYGDRQQSLFGSAAKSQTLGNLPYTKALKLLALPEEDREEFVRENDVESLSVRELEKKIRAEQEAKQAAEERAGEAEKKELDQRSRTAAAEKRADEMEIRARTAEQEAEKLRDKLELEKKNARIAAEEVKKMKENPEVQQEALEKLRAEAEAAAAKRAAEDLEKAVRDAEKQAAEAREAAKKAAEEANSQKARAEELEKRLRTSGPELTEFKLQLRLVQEDMEKMLEAMERAAEAQPETAERMKKAVLAVLEKWQEEVG